VSQARPQPGLSLYHRQTVTSTALINKVQLRFPLSKFLPAVSAHRKGRGAGGRCRAVAGRRQRAQRPPLVRVMVESRAEQWEQGALPGGCTDLARPRHIRAQRPRTPAASSSSRFLISQPISGRGLISGVPPAGAGREGRWEGGGGRGDTRKGWGISGVARGRHGAAAAGCSAGEGGTRPCCPACTPHSCPHGGGHRGGAPPGAPPGVLGHETPPGLASEAPKALLGPLPLPLIASLRPLVQVGNTSSRLVRLAS